MTSAGLTIRPPRLGAPEQGAHLVIERERLPVREALVLGDAQAESFS